MDKTAMVPLCVRRECIIARPLDHYLYRRVWI
jgi:hypothetical protein